MATKIEPLMTVTDLEAMPEDGNRYEVIEGELFVSCAPGLTHQQVSMNISFLIRSYLEGYPIGLVFATPGLILTEMSGVIPDIVFFRHERSHDITSGERLTERLISWSRFSRRRENIRRDRCQAPAVARNGIAVLVVDPRSELLEV